jgi:hypothetical protein
MYILSMSSFPDLLLDVILQATYPTTGPKVIIDRNSIFYFFLKLLALEIWPEYFQKEKEMNVVLA